MFVVKLLLNVFFPFVLVECILLDTNANRCVIQEGACVKPMRIVFVSNCILIHEGEWYFGNIINVHIYIAMSFKHDIGNVQNVTILFQNRKCIRNMLKIFYRMLQYYLGNDG